MSLWPLFFRVTKPAFSFPFPFPHPIFLRSCNQYLLITGYFRHIVHVDIEKNRVLPLTHGPYEVNRLLHWDQVDNWM